MLREVWKSVKLPLNSNETLSSLDGLIVGPGPTDTNTNYLYVFGLVTAPVIGGGAGVLWVFDAVTGAFIRRAPGPGILGWIFQMNGVEVSRKGVIWAKHYYSNELHTISLGATATALPGEEPTTPVGWTTGGLSIPASKFKTNVEGTSDIIGFGVWAIDDSRDRFINAYGSTSFDVCTFSSGAFLFRTFLSDEIVAICLEDDTRCYILLANRVLVLFDYMRGEVLGAAKIPPLQGTGNPNYWNNTNVGMTWYPNYRRPLMLEKASADSYVRGFSVVNDPCRLTKPLPLRVPRQGRTIPVLVQVVDELNHGLGEYAVETRVTGFGSLVGTPLTNYKGDALIQVALIGSPLYSPTSPDGEVIVDVSPPVHPGGGTGAVPSIGKSMWIGWFEATLPGDTVGSGLAYIPPGNCYTWTKSNAIVTTLEYEQFATFIDGDEVDIINGKAQAMNTPVLAYWDHRTWPEWPVLENGDWLCLQAYCRNDETPADFEINMRALINSVPSQFNQICLVCQCYTSNTNNTSNLIGLVPVYARLARDNIRVSMLMTFTDQGRDTGLKDHPEVKPYWVDLFAGVPSSPMGLR